MTLLLDILERIRFSAWRIELDTPCVHATTPMLRGVWGRALKFVDESAYLDVFEGVGPTSHRIPKYIIRPAPPDPATAPAIDFILLNVESSMEKVLWRAWLVANGMGLGAQREPFRIRQRVPLISMDQHANVLDLLARDWPLHGRPAEAGCRLAFSTPLRILRKGKLLEAPSLSDIVVAAGRRVAHVAGVDRGSLYRDFLTWIRDEAGRMESSPWQGERADLIRWSAAQKREVALYGVTGNLVLLRGPAALWPLLAVVRWLHVGKGSVFGMGQLEIFQI